MLWRATGGKVYNISKSCNASQSLRSGNSPWNAWPICRAVSVDKRITKVIKCQENSGVLFQIFLLFASTQTLKNTGKNPSPISLFLHQLWWYTVAENKYRVDWSDKAQGPGAGLHSATGTPEAWEETLWWRKCTLCSWRKCHSWSPFLKEISQSSIRNRQTCTSFILQLIFHFT